MLEFISTERTILDCIFNIVLYIIIYYLFSSARRAPYYLSDAERKSGFILILIFFVFAFWAGDWFHLYIPYDEIRAGGFSSMENIYKWISQNIAPNYIIFRLVVWGSGLLFVYKLANRLPINANLTLYMFVVFGVLWFSYARVSLAMAMMFFGVSILYSPNRNKAISYIFGCGLITISYFFHKSALFGIGIIVISFFFGMFKRKVLVFTIILIPLIVTLIKSALSDVLVMESQFDGSDFSHSVYTAQRYLSADEDKKGISAIIPLIAERTIYIGTSFICLKEYLSSKFEDTPEIIKLFMRILIFITIISIILSFDMGFNTTVLAYRLFRFSFIPVSILIAYFYENNIFPKLSGLIILLGVFVSLYYLFYTLYCTIVAG